MGTVLMGLDGGWNGRDGARGRGHRVRMRLGLWVIVRVLSSVAADYTGRCFIPISLLRLIDASDAVS